MGKAKCWVLNIILTGVEGVCLQELARASEACGHCELSETWRKAKMPGIFLFCFLMQTWLGRNLCVQYICRVKARTVEIKIKYLQVQNTLQVCGWTPGTGSLFQGVQSHHRGFSTLHGKGTKRHFAVSSAFSCLLGTATWRIFRVLMSGSHLEAKQVVQDWLIGLCQDKICCTCHRGLFLTAPEPSSHMDTHVHSYVFPFRDPWNTREIFLPSTVMSNWRNRILPWGQRWIHDYEQFSVQGTGALVPFSS